VFAKISPYPLIPFTSIFELLQGCQGQLASQERGGRNVPYMGGVQRSVNVCEIWENMNATYLIMRRS
jgi:hypothetical protein